jgi:hypothetical protein
MISSNLSLGPTTTDVVDGSARLEGLHDVADDGPPTDIKQGLVLLEYPAGGPSVARGHDGIDSHIPV